MTDLPEGQTQSYSQEEEMRKSFYKTMVDRFLSWKLPEAFHPDAGISFKAEYNEGTPWPMRHEPIGTNLLSADQAMEMFKHCVDMTGIENRFTELFAENMGLKERTASQAEQVRQANERVLRVLRGEFTQICSHCGWEAAASGASWGELQAHIKECPTHPVHLLTEQVRKLETELSAARENGKYGWDTAREAHKVYEAEHMLLLAANEIIATLQARIEAANKQSPVGWVCKKGTPALNAWHEPITIGTKFYIKPPITSERELELLAVIEQKDAAIKAAIARTIRRLYETCPDCDTQQKCNETKTCCMCKNVEPELTLALALTPDLSALKELRKP